jgi:hypothetical protein
MDSGAAQAPRLRFLLLGGEMQVVDRPSEALRYFQLRPNEGAVGDQLGLHVVEYPIRI